MKKIKIGGVPEHFNLPWHLTIEEGSYEKNNISLEWTDFPGGTGAMCNALREKEIDIAIILTEGIVKDITEGNPSKIIQTYIETPLIWGIHVAADTEYTQISQIENTKAAISRYGSGSHLMAYVNAQQNGWDTNRLSFEVIKNLDGAIEALTDHQADYFMWEHFTTKPLVDKGIFRRIADCPTPWPCFVIAARQEIIDTYPDELLNILEIINTTTADFKSIPSIDNTLAIRYEQQIEDIQKWLQITEWSQKNIAPETIEKVQEQLLSLQIIETKISYDTLVHSF
ncbi:ABC transporter substrate-binding protein [Aquimarina sp. TRL1]|uniref:substrate-binding domain-containing protein n=1 Tax=Aquimarina sp. (strain TRL1) TaxID=2736252 RepID=UPI00158E771A|nr:substrate-binding domain-containing protein [Aquimarina sp. TRL1]QKX06882.1 ABC transporter substrate-binding protein [Aquimarina sp. TRL1]